MKRLTNFYKAPFFTDKLNIFLVLFSALLAFIFPLELFIFSYAIIGPLHYITEIKWLHQKNYFFTEDQRVWLSAGIVATLVIFIPKVYFKLYGEEGSLYDVLNVVNEWSNSVIFSTLLFAGAYQFRFSKTKWIMVAIIAIIGSIGLKNIESYQLIIGVFVPTIIHVYLFTIIFMLYGARRSHSTYGYFAIACAVTVPVVIISLDLTRDSYLFGNWWKEVYLSNNFHVTPVLFSKFMGISDGNSFFFYESMELKLMMFISFIYCYHYLNWFSKTTVIKWHKNINRRTGIAIVAIWIVSLIVYFYSITWGLLLFLFMGFLHVILEFPLNMYSLRELFKNES